MPKQKPSEQQASLFPTTKIGPSRYVWGMGNAYVVITRVPAGASDLERHKALMAAYKLAKKKRPPIQTYW